MVYLRQNSEGRSGPQPPPRRHYNYNQNRPQQQRGNGRDYVPNIPSVFVPRIATKEKIFIFLDRSADLNKMEMKLTDGSSVVAFDRLKKVIGMFVANKRISLCQRGENIHEYGLITGFGDNPVVLQQPMTNTQEFLSNLDDISIEEESGEFDLGSVLTQVVNETKEKSFLDLPSPTSNLEEVADKPPEYIVRLVLFITRSHSVPKITWTDETKKLISHPLFFLDIVYLHEYRDDQANQVQSVLSRLQELETPRSYLRDLGPNVSELHNIVASLLFNPLLRSYEKDKRWSPNQEIKSETMEQAKSHSQ